MERFGTICNEIHNWKMLITKLMVTFYSRRNVKDRIVKAGPHIHNALNWSLVTCLLGTLCVDIVSAGISQRKLKVSLIQLQM